MKNPANFAIGRVVGNFKNSCFMRHKVNDFFLKKTAKRRGNFETFSYLCENIINQ